MPQGALNLLLLGRSLAWRSCRGRPTNASGCPYLPALPHPQASAQYFSLSDLDLACARWFFLVRQLCLAAMPAAKWACAAQTCSTVGGGKGPASLA